MKYIIINGKILYKEEFIDNYDILFSDKIENILPHNKVNLSELSDYKVIDAMGQYIVPGFIDQHIHGYMGFDTMDATDEAFWSMRSNLVKNGVTSFLPSTVTYSEDILDEVCKIAREHLNKNGGAKVQGIHLEGPFINIEKKGAQNEKYISAITEEFVERNLDVLKVVTVAPEVEGVNELVSKYKDKINFQMGHSGATFEEACVGIESGIKGVTHLFNAMSPIHHRDLGVVGAALTKGIYAEMICDNIHVTKDAYEFVVKNLGVDKTLLITDCLSAGGLEDGKYTLGGLDVVLEDNACRLLDGTLAGSTLPLNKAVYNINKNTSYSLADCIKMVTKNQAQYLNLQDKIGELEVGFLSDIVIMDRNCNIIKTFVSGVCEYEIWLQRNENLRAKGLWWS